MSHIFKHLHSTATCFNSYNSLCFKIIDKANSKFDLKIKEALHINWRKPNLNAQQNHLALTNSLELLSPLTLFCLWFFVFCFSLSSIIFIVCDTYRHHSSRYNTPSIIPFPFIYYFHYLYTNYRHLLLS